MEDCDSAKLSMVVDVNESQGFAKKCAGFAVDAVLYGIFIVIYLILMIYAKSQDYVEHVIKTTSVSRVIKYLLAMFALAIPVICSTKRRSLMTGGE